MATITTLYGNKNKEGARKVYFQVTHKNKRVRIPTELWILKNEITAGGKVKNIGKLMDIDKMKKSMEEKLYRLSVDNAGMELDLDQIVTYITQKDGDLDFLAFASEWVADTSVKGKKNYVTMLNNLKAFIRSDRLPVSHITFEFLASYEKSMEGKPRAQSLYLGLFRHLFREAVRRYNTELVQPIKYDPFTRYRVPKQQLKKGVRALSLEELMKVYNYTGTGRAGLARDCFILSFCLMGINSVDLYEAKTLKAGKLCYERTKTKDRRSDGAYIEVKIHPVIAPLVKKYKDEARAFDFHRRYVQAREFNRALNIGLKTVGKAVGIDNLQFYQARHTFATLSRNLMGFSKGDVDEALNHIGNYDVADIYIKKDFSIINRNNFALLDRVFALKMVKS